MLFPSDILDVDHAGVYLNLRQFKALGRQPARIQYMEIHDSVASRLLCSIYEHYPKDAPLFSGSPSLYRRRWDAILKLCSFPKELKLTPGGLRGGAAVMMYRKRVPIQDILWRLRLRTQGTLESYLQETAASAVLASLDAATRQRLLNIACLFPCLGHSFPGPHS